MDEALAFKYAHPEEKATTAARIYSVNDSTLRTNLQRARLRGSGIAPAKRGGQNKILSNAQVDAIYKYVEDSYLSGYGATKMMVFAAIGCLRANEIPPKDAPSWRWFQTYLAGSAGLARPRT
jgi:hypothetical protein